MVPVTSSRKASLLDAQTRLSILNLARLDLKIDALPADLTTLAELSILRLLGYNYVEVCSRLI